MAAPAVVNDLVERFTGHRDEYRSGRYNETQLRRDFLDPLFAALGWDVHNEQGYAEAYREVIHEAAIKIGGRTKAPDYCFRAGGGVRSFFVEAKKPSIDIRDAIGPAYQLRRYAWSAKLPVSILSDFEEFAVYDCRVRPNQTDKASTARVFYLKYTEYIERWDELHGLFSPEAIRRGDLDKFISSKKAKKGTAEVDKAFLDEIESWRDVLARNVALRNKGISPRDLNFAVQRTIDRTVFLRICEDRGIEPYGTLLGVTNGPKVYARLGELFQRADDRYNSGLFYFTPEKGRNDPPDELTLGLTIDDKPLNAVIKNLYYPDSPYEFSVLPAEILGQVYEQFLGKVIRLTRGGQAKVEEKPEVRKAGGVYYTPKYIVDYIVEHTVGKLLEGKTPHEVGALTKKTWQRSKRGRPLTVLDPACGSGSFLIGAYQHLLDWHRDQYVAADPEQHARGSPPRLYRGPAGAWRLTTAEKKRILLSNIYGVDIDPQAVEVTKLSLLLKVLEGESQQTLSNQLRLFHERALPDLSSNIKCGNSLIGPDFYDDRQMSLLDEEERYRVNVFDWKAEFPDIFKGKNPGFDAVIGNPPYVLLQDEFRDDVQLDYFRSQFKCASYKLDTYHLFIEHGLRVCSRDGRFSMITPANFLTNNYLNGLRRHILTESEVDHIVIMDGGVFHGISVDNAVFVLSRGAQGSGAFRLLRAKPSSSGLDVVRQDEVSVHAALRDTHVLFTGGRDAASARLWERIESVSDPLGDMAHVNFGKQLRNRKQYTEDVIKVKSVKAVPIGYKPCYTGRDVTRYRLGWNGLACLDDKVAQCGGCWHPARHGAKNKLVTRQIGRYPEFAVDPHGYQCLNTVFMVNAKSEWPDAFFLLGILNSRLLRALWLQRYYDQRRTFPKIKGTYLKELPIPKSETHADKSHQLPELAGRMTSLTEKLKEAGTAHQKTVIRRQIDATDRQIDRLVYELYDLTDEEIAIVEEATRGKDSNMKGTCR